MAVVNVMKKNIHHRGRSNNVSNKQAEKKRKT